MKIYYSATSPYVRKVMACAIIRGVDGRTEKRPSNPHESPADLLADNPLSKVPCLVTDDGVSLFGSRLICGINRLSSQLSSRAPALLPAAVISDAVPSLHSATDPLPSWRAGRAKGTILEFLAATTNRAWSDSANWALWVARSASPTSRPPEGHG
jgi:hypothetical protein